MLPPGLRRIPAVLGGRTSFNPLSLFIGGVTGIWLDPSDMSTMWQDIAGTTPVTAAGQNVGRILDKSPSGLILASGAVGQRPVLQQDASNKWYLQFSSANLTNLFVTGAFNIGTAVVGLNFSPSGTAFTGILTNTADQTSGVDFAFSTANGNLSWQNTPQAAGDSLANSTHFWSNGVQTTAVTASTPIVYSCDGTGFPSTMQFPNGLLIGTDRNNAGRNTNGKLYQAVTTSTILATATRRKTENYVGSKMGVGPF